MNAREEARRMAEVMMAFADGAHIQAATRLNKHNWDDLPPWASPRFDWDHNDYRVKPEPREEWRVVDKDGRDWGGYANAADAQRYADRCAHSFPSSPTFRIAHMREVTE